MNDGELRRVAWRCRRGHLELDLLLQRFLREGYADLAPTGRAAFVRLLALSDTTLMRLLLPEQGARSAAVDEEVDTEMRDILERVAGAIAH